MYLSTVNCTATQTWSTHSISSLAHERRVRVDLRITAATETFSIELSEHERGAAIDGSWVSRVLVSRQLGCVSVNSCLVRESLGRARIPSLWQW